MTVTRLRTVDLPAAQRFGAWHDLTIGSHVPMAIDSDHRDDFRATVDLYDFGGVQLSRLRFPALRGRRTQRLIRQSDPELLMVSHVQHGRQIAQHGRDECVVGAEHILVHNTWLPGTVINDAPITNVVLQISRSTLDPKGLLADRLLVSPIPATRGIGAILAAILADLAEHGDTHPPAVIAQLTATALDLLAAAARISAGAPGSLPEPTRVRIRQSQIHNYVRRRLHDTTLTLNDVADAHGLSIRQLYRIFEADGTTPAGWIRRQRLEQCRRELADPALAQVPVVAIGARWGFPDPATFNRAFRREFGLAPGEYRRQITQLG